MWVRVPEEASAFYQLLCQIFPGSSMVERHSVKVMVGGSSPPQGAIKKKGKVLKDSLGNEIEAGDRVFVAKSGVFNGQAHLGKIKSIDDDLAYIHVKGQHLNYGGFFKQQSIIKITQDILDCEI